MAWNTFLKSFGQYQWIDAYQNFRKTASEWDYGWPTFMGWNEDYLWLKLRQRGRWEYDPILEETLHKQAVSEWVKNTADPRLLPKNSLNFIKVIKAFRTKQWI